MVESSIIKYHNRFLCTMEFEKRRIELVNILKNRGRIKTAEVEKAFLETPRELFVPEEIKNYAYLDTPLEIGNCQTISAPHMVAIMAEALDLKEGQRVLEIGAGSGYHAAIISKIIGEDGKIYTVERIKELAQMANQNLIKAGVNNVTVVIGDGSIGFKKFAPYDIIYVTCASPEIPKPLLDQLKDPGQLLIPLGHHLCRLTLIEKKEGKITKGYLGGCAFVPLVGKYGH